MNHSHKHVAETQQQHNQHEHGDHGGHGGHAGHSEAMFARPFWISLVLTIPILIYAPLMQDLFGYSAPAFPGSQYIGFALGSIIFWYGGRVFLSGAQSELSRRRPGMMTLVAMAISVAYLYSILITFGVVGGQPFYWELASLVTIMLLGHWMEMRAVGSAQSALSELAKLLPDQAERLVDGQTETVAVGDLQQGDLVLVRPGASVPADGEIEAGSGNLNESMITGESRPVNKNPGDDVIAGTVNGNRSLRVRITRTGEETALSGIMRLVQEAQTSRSRAQALADTAAAWLAYIAIGVALLPLAGWLLVRGFDAYTLERVVTVLVVACPHALGLAIPLVLAISTTLAARSGILVRDRLAMEASRKLDSVIFDKTGTLTKGEQGLVGIAVATELSEEQALVQAAALERDSEHMIARAIVTGAEERELHIPSARTFEAIPGQGVQAELDGQTLLVGGPRLLEARGLDVPEALAQQTRQWGERGQTVVYLLADEHVVAAFALADVIRPESYEAVAGLQQQGVQVAMLTGDSEDVARRVAGELGITPTSPRCCPSTKPSA